VTVLARRVGVRHLELVEDAVQAAMMTALSTWTAQGLPSDPGAWLYRVARNQLLGELRRESGRLRILEQASPGLAGEDDGSPAFFFPGEVRDDLLRMLFICCDDAIPRESQLVLALKTLCGFSTGEIALRLFTSEANVHKRLGRARDRLREAAPTGETPPLEALRSRLPGVHEVLYLLFNEGYLSAHTELTIRRELCEEAIRLATLLADHPVGQAPETFALLALLHLHAARLGARIDGDGGLLLLEEQDRSLWDRDRIGVGAMWLARAARQRPASPPSIALLLLSSRRAGRRSPSSIRSWSA
jgi:RNA polymerase sigma-70 factor (ECF subfamily)